MSKKKEELLTACSPDQELTWLKKDERIMYFKSGELDTDFKDELKEALEIDRISAAVTEESFSVDGVREDGIIFKVTPDEGDHGQNCYISISEVGTYTAVKHCTYIDPPKLPLRPGKQKTPGGSGILENLKSAVIGLALFIAGKCLIDIKDLELARDIDLPMTAKAIHIPLPTIEFEALRNVGWIILAIGAVLLLFGAGCAILNIARRSLNVKVAYNEKEWNNAWKDWEENTLIPAFRDSRVYDAIYESTVLASMAAFGTQPLRTKSTVNRLSDLQNIANIYQTEKK